MKIINCPGCGRENRNRHYCLSCGCYLPPLLEEEQEEPEDVLFKSLAKEYGINRIEYDMMRRQMGHVPYTPAQPTYATVQAQPTYVYLKTDAERDICGRIKAPGGC